MNRRLFYASLFALVTLTAKSQIGTNWVQKTYPEFLDAQVDSVHTFLRQVPQEYTATNDYCSYTNAGGVEEFQVQSTHANRIEIRVQNDYQAPAGGRQFEGDVMLLPPSGHQSLVQIFGNDAHATLFMLHGGASDGGSLRHYDREVLATNVYNTWVHVNVIHMPGEFVQVYLDGVLKGQWPDDSGDHPHYFKYGCYGTLDGESSHVKWQNVKFFVGGQPPAPEGSKSEEGR